jgi:hypothetical protein
VEFVETITLPILFGQNSEATVRQIQNIAANARILKAYCNHLDLEALAITGDGLVHAAEHGMRVTGAEPGFRYRGARRTLSVDKNYIVPTRDLDVSLKYNGI